MAATGRQEAWRSLVQRGVDTAAEFSDVVAQKLGTAADPRAKLLRKRRWALRAGLFFTFSTGLWIVVTAILGSWDVIPAWVLPIPGAIAVGAAFLATLSFLRYRWLRGEPLPPERNRRPCRNPFDRGCRSLLTSAPSWASTRLPRAPSGRCCRCAR